MAIVDLPTFSLEDVRGELGGSPNPYTLSDAFAEAVFEKFDPRYHAAEERLSRFQNYPIEPDAPSTPCGGGPYAFPGGLSYPTQKNFDMGDNTGVIEVVFDPQTVPDRLMVYWNGNVTLDTGYRSGDPARYNAGGADVALFHNALAGRVDPLSGLTYPSDGYGNPPIAGEIDFPVVLRNASNFSYAIYKTAATSNIISLKIYAPMTGTAWDILSLKCPVSAQLRYPTIVEDTMGKWIDKDNVKQEVGEAIGDVSREGAISNETGPLICRGFQFNIPANATILGAWLKINRRASEIGKAEDITLILFNNGFPMGYDKSSFYTWEDVNTVDEFGSVSDLWNVALTPSIVNSPEFGVKLEAWLKSGTGNYPVYVQWVTLEIAWEIP